MLCLELAVPIDLGVVELEDAVALGDLDVEVVWAGQHLVLEGPELGLGADIIDLINHGPDLGVLVEDDLCDEVLVGDIVFSEVEMCWGPFRQGRCGKDRGQDWSQDQTYLRGRQC